MQEKKETRLFALDLLRVLACFLVIWQHVTECYYINPDLTAIKNQDTAIIGWINSLTPIEVPLFVMISGYFLLPLKTDVSTFFRRRFTRILYPFVSWCVIYAFYYMYHRGDTLKDVLVNIAHIPVNFGTEIGHMWFIYMLLGLYLLVPVVSPWLQQCSQRQLQGYLGLWAFTTCLPYIHLVFPAVLGECFWNPSPLLHYFTGFAGYFILGYYIRRYGALSIRQSLIAIAGGYLITAILFQLRLPHVTMVSDLEVCWRFCSLNIMIMAYGVFSLITRIPWNNHGLIARFISRFAVLSYAVYFIHLMLIFFFQPLLNILPVPVFIKIPLITVCCFFTAFILVRLLAYLPKSKYWLG